MKLITSALLLSGLLSTTDALAGGAAWHADFDAAVAVAKEQKKDLLVDFTGSDWCGWCIRLDKEVFAHEAFLKPMQEKYVLVALDFPRDPEVKAKVPNPERNEELSAKYMVQGFPTVLVMTVDGDVLVETGYRDGGPESYVAFVEEEAAKGRTALAAVGEVLTAFEAAQGEAKMAAWERVMSAMETHGSTPAGRKLIQPVRWALEADADNAKGMKLRAVKALLDSGNADATVLVAAEELDPKNESGMMEKAVGARFQIVQDDETALAALAALDRLAPLGFKDKELGFQLTFTAAMWSSGPLADPERAKQYATAAKAIGTEEKEALEALEEILKA